MGSNQHWKGIFGEGNQGAWDGTAKKTVCGGAKNGFGLADQSTNQ